MNKIIPLLIVGIMVLSGLGAAAVTHSKQILMEKTETIIFSYPEISIREGQTVLSIDNSDTWLYTTNAPMLPISVNTYIFPFGTKIKTVDVMFSDPQIQPLEKALLTAPHPVTSVNGKKILYIEEENEITSFYPDKLFDYHLGAGLSGQDHVLFVTIRCFPIQYDLEKNSILFRDNVHLSITYELPKTVASTVDDYKLIVIAPKAFSETLLPLVNHKISKGITTKLVTRNDICDGVYFPVQGRDCAEEMKYFIKNAFDQWGTRYVLLVGGRYGGVLKEKWWVPVRYSHLDDGYNWEGSYLSDLYFADLYDSNGSFSSWDSDNNGIFAEWNSQRQDIIDMYPEVCVGRLACKNVIQVKTLVNKITVYENTTVGKDWFNRMVVVGGDSTPNATDPWYEGEEENKLALEYMTGFEGVKLWTSTGTFTGPQDVMDAINKGCGFLFFDGHGNPMSWSTHPPYNDSSWINGLEVRDMPKLTNGEQLPVTVCGGCHNGQFNTSLLNILKGIIQEQLQYFKWKFFLGEWTPECWAWKLISVKNGGCIATMAYTGLDWFAEGDYNNDSIPDCVQFFSGYANTQFFKNYGVNNITILGEAHTQSLIDYLTTFPPMLKILDCKTVQEFVLLGDPSLKIGGYA